jgi:hypothetical protein
MATNGITLSLRPNGVENAILGLLNQANDQDQLPAFIEDYVGRSGIERARFSDPVRTAMVRYLLDRGVRLGPGDVAAAQNGDFDELFAMAYAHAVETASGGSDPIDAARQPGGGQAGAAWDFSVDTFDDIERQGIVRENILAGGAVDYLYELGDRLGIFRLVDALVLNWASGSIDVVEGATVARLNRYWKLRDERPSTEERGMLYRRVLNKGTTEVLSRMVANEPFPPLWHNLMSEVADYIDKSERVSEGTRDSSPVSRSRIFQATQELQYNLTEYCTGMAHIQARELYAQLQECMEILGDPEILAYFGGNRRKSVWTVIEQLSKQEFGAAPNIGAHRSLAVDGNAVYRWIADFNEGAASQADFTAFLQAAESYILNFSIVGDAAPELKSEDELDDEDDTAAEGDDDF